MDLFLSGTGVVLESLIILKAIWSITNERLPQLEKNILGGF